MSDQNFESEIPQQSWVLSYEDLESFLRPGADEERLSFLGRHARPGNCAHDYPFVHRILDVVLAGHGYRIVRCISCDESLFVQKIPREQAGPMSPGVPLELRGMQLRSWVEHEAGIPESDGPDEEAVDWNFWLNYGTGAQSSA